jgi:hypothetical protein
MSTGSQGGRPPLLRSDRPRRVAQVRVAHIRVAQVRVAQVRVAQVRVVQLAHTLAPDAREESTQLS